MSQNVLDLSELSKNRFQLVIIETPYDTYRELPFTRLLMTDLMKLKFDNYRAFYPYGIMPVGEYDFVGNHIILCEVDKNYNYTPLTAFKSVSLKQCQNFNLDFPFFDQVLKGDTEKLSEHIEAYEKWLRDASHKPGETCYNASWVVSLEIKDPKIKEFLKQVSLAMGYYYFSSYHLKNIICGASSRYRVNKIKEKLGFKYLKDGSGNILEKVSSERFVGEEICIMHSDPLGFPKSIATFSEGFKHFWDKRVVINEAYIDQVGEWSQSNQYDIANNYRLGA